MKTKIEIGEHLRMNGVKPSFQRVRIYEYLNNNYIHPTVDMIYRELVLEIPTLSKTTVYNTLKIFVDSKIVSLVNIEGTETRYDAKTGIHGHFKCEKCSEIYDFEYDDSDIKISELNGFQIEKKEFYLKGICKTCLQ